MNPTKLILMIVLGIASASMMIRLFGGGAEAANLAAAGDAGTIVFVLIPIVLFFSLLIYVFFREQAKEIIGIERELLGR